MKTSTRVACVLALALLVAAPAAAAKRVVDSSDGQASATNCGASNAAYFSISTALVASSPGDIIIICPGSGPYNEQLSIDKQIKLQGVGNATVRPAPMVANSTSLSSGAPIAAAILIEDGVTGVVIDKLTVDGSGHGLAGCSPNIIGVYFRNSSGSVTNSAVRHFRMGAGLGGCQVGLGIFAQSDPLGPGISNVTVTNSSVHDFQKNGITGNEPGTTLVANGNYVTGDGPTPNIAQNGIQIGFGAKGTITGNMVSEVVYSQCVDPSAPNPNPCNNGSSTGILVYDAGGVSTVSQNTVTTTQTGVYLDASNSFANQNLITRTMQYDGIYLPSGADSNQIQANAIVNSDEAGIWVDGTGNSITKNKINEAPIGIHHACGNSAPVTTSAKNVFYNVAVAVDAETCVASASAARAASVAASPAR
jgi:hypothetical protein